MAKCTETCPKCGAKHVYTGRPEETWYCGSRGEYQSVQCRIIAELRSQLADANVEIKRRDDIIKHCWIHSGYENSGYAYMTTKQKELYKAIGIKDHPHA